MGQSVFAGERRRHQNDARAASTKDVSRLRSYPYAMILHARDEPRTPVDDCQPGDPPPGPLRGPTSPSRGEVKYLRGASRLIPTRGEGAGCHRDVRSASHIANRIAGPATHELNPPASVGQSSGRKP